MAVVTVPSEVFVDELPERARVALRRAFAGAGVPVAGIRLVYEPLLAAGSFQAAEHHG